MWIVIGAIGIVVLGLAAFAGLGKFGEMPAEAVNDRPKGHIPEGSVTHEFLQELSVPTASSGYDKDEVDAYLRAIVNGTAAPAAETLFTVVKRGYDMQVIDNIIERPRYERPTAQVGPTPDETAGDNVSDVEVIELGEESDDADLTSADVGNEPTRPSGLPDTE